jgi:glucosamine-6-phosphate deaminase
MDGVALEFQRSMEVIIQANEAQAAGLVARLVAREVRSNPHAVLGLATGRTMEAVYCELTRLHREEALDFSLCRTFNLDEYVGLSPTDSNSYRQYMNRHLFHQVNLDIRNTHLPDGMASDLAAECVAYERAIERAGGIDFQLLGIGQSGHIGFNEPLSALKSRTREKALTPTTIAQNAPLFDRPEQMPRRAITMGVVTILDGRRCVLLATGAAKAEIIARAVEGPISSMISATALQLHPHCTVVVDEAAAVRLQESDYYRWVFRHEPEWADFQ